MATEESGSFSPVSWLLPFSWLLLLSWLLPFFLAPHRAVSSGANSGASQRMLSAAVTAEMGAKGYRTEMSQSIKGWGRPPHPGQAGRTWWPTSLGVWPGLSSLSGRSPESSLKVPRGSPKVKHTHRTANELLWALGLRFPLCTLLLGWMQWTPARGQACSDVV